MSEQWPLYANSAFECQDAAVHGSALLIKLWNSREKGDFEFQTRDGTLRAHSAVVSACSPVFEAMLSSPMVEAKNNSMKIEAESSTVLAMLQFAYLGDFGIEPLEIAELLKLAHQYEMTSLIEKCCALMVENVDFDTAVPFLEALRLLDETPKEPESPIEEMERVEQLVKMPLKAGCNYFLVSKKWYTEWQQWVGYCQNVEQKSSKRQRTESEGTKRPGRIHNLDLLSGDEGLDENFVELRDGVRQHHDFEILPESAWNLLCSHYGGGPAIKRRAIQQLDGSIQVVLWGEEFEVYISSDIGNIALCVVESELLTVKNLKTYLCSDLALDPKKVRLWAFDASGSSRAKLDKKAKLLDHTYDNMELQAFFMLNVLLDLQTVEGTWSIANNGVCYSSCANQSSDKTLVPVPAVTRAFAAISKKISKKPKLLMLTLKKL
eukprot:TRINITY_DN13583_c4_g1_i1.p1 TRINITY_DN13583_c4_g1~~TRINITY_DN13583_c4_g1_i1.p1  ORF type:complete len:448 (-),score=94.03 TRINITY_DN13583_c4_g1_i1:254-1558(-)